MERSNSLAHTPLARRKDIALLEKKIKDSESGQALVETAICLPIYVVIILGLFFFGEGYLYKLHTAQAARLAVGLYSGGTSLAKDNQAVTDIVKASYFPRESQQITVDPAGFLDSILDSFGFDRDAGPKGEDDFMGSIWKHVTGAMLPVVTGATVTYHHQNPFGNSTVSPFDYKTYDISYTVYMEGNPWAYEEVSDIPWYSTYASLLVPAVGGLVIDAIKEAIDSIGSIFKVEGLFNSIKELADEMINPGQKQD